MLLQSVSLAAEAVPASSTVDAVGNFIAPLVLMIMGVVILQAVFQRRMAQAGIMAVVAAVATLILYDTQKLFETVNSFFTAMVSGMGMDAKPEATPAPPVAEKTSKNAGDVPWEILGFVALAVLLLGVAGLIIFIAVRKAKAAAYDRKTNTAGWEKLIARNREVRQAWGAYETDMAKIIDFPMMNDMKEPTVNALHGALRKAMQLEPASAKVVAHIPYAESPFAGAVQDLEIAFETAEREAKKIAWSKFTVEERKNLTKAKDLLALAMDTGASASERQVAYKRVIKELEGLVAIPNQAIMAIEAATKLELASV